MCPLQPPRWNIDDWDAMMMERDRRLTGSLRGQRVRSSSFQSADSELPTKSCMRFFLAADGSCRTQVICKQLGMGNGEDLKWTSQNVKLIYVRQMLP